MAKELDEAVEAFRTRSPDGGPCTYVWLDALTQKVREGGRIANVAALVNVAGFPPDLGLGPGDLRGWSGLARLRSLAPGPRALGLPLLRGQ